MYTKNQVIINTGNILNLIDIKKKVQNATEELTESLQITLDEFEKTSNKQCTEDIKSICIYRVNDDTRAKMSAEERKDLKVGIKIFTQEDNPTSLEECLETLFKTLGIDLIDNVVLAYNPISTNGEEQNTPNHISDKVPNGIENSANAENDTVKCDQILPGLKILWQVLEKYVTNERISQVGVADLDEMCFRSLHESSKVRPSIVQINLASCCVVPPGLQTFCKDNDIQLLTHSDPPEIISKESLCNVMKAQVNLMQWCARYQVHIKCRGVLALKGYILNANLNKS